MAKIVDAEMQTHLDGEVQSLCTCWAVRRKDGVDLFFTDHDQDIDISTRDLFSEGDTVLRNNWLNAKYLAHDGMTRTAVKSSEAEIDNLTIEGILLAGGVNSADIVAGQYDGAEVYAFTLRWDDPTVGVVRLPGSGTIGEVKMKPRQGVYAAELRGLGQFLTHQIGHAYSPVCQADVFDKKCRLDESLFYQHGVVSSVTDRRFFKADLASPAVFDDQPLTILNNSFEFESIQVLDNWTVQGAYPADHWGRSGPWNTDTQEGDYSAGVVHGDDETVDVETSTASDPISISIDGVDEPTTAEIAAGKVVIDVSCWMIEGGEFEDIHEDWGRLGVIFLDTNGDVLGKQLSDPIRKFQHIESAKHGEPTTAKGSWTDCTRRFHLLPGTTDVQIVIAAAKGYPLVISVPLATKNPQIFFDLIRATVKPLTAINIGMDRDSVTDQAWFDGGVVKFTSGSNLTRAQEIDVWDNGLKELRMYLQLPFLPAVGDQFIIYPGCHKRWAEDCATKWDNAVNFRGDPFVPGNDELFTTKDVR